MTEETYHYLDEYDISHFPDLQNRDYFLTAKRRCACRLNNGTVVELPTNGVIDPAHWNPSTRIYVSHALRALAQEDIKFELVNGYTDGRVQFEIGSDRPWLGWGAIGFTESGEPKFTLYGSFH